MAGFRFGSSPSGPSGVVQMRTELQPSPRPSPSPAALVPTRPPNDFATQPPTHEPTPRPTNAGVRTVRPTHVPSSAPSGTQLPSWEPSAAPSPRPSAARWEDLGRGAGGCVAEGGRGFCLVTTPPDRPLDAPRAHALCRSLGYAGLATISSDAERAALNHFDLLVPEDDEDGTHPAWVAGSSRGGDAAWQDADFTWLQV